MRKYRFHTLFIITIALFVVIFFFLGEIILPFFIGLLLAHAFSPSIKKIQRFIPNRNLAVTFFLAAIVIISTTLIFVLGNHIVHDFKRLNNAFTIFANNNSENIDNATDKVKTYIASIYDLESLENQFDLESKIDSLEIDSETITESLTKITSFFASPEDEQVTESKFSNRNYNWFLIFFYSLGYFVYILYTYNYFDKRFQKYFAIEKKSNSFVDEMIKDFKSTFSDYFRQRSKVVLISMLIFITSFLIIGIPGAILIGIIAGFLCYITNFHYFALIPLSLSCWALSVEQNQSFFLFFGLVLAVLILISVLEETVFFPKIMKGVSSMNPAIMIISLSVWSYVFGTIGLFLALPLTSILLIYLGKILSYRKERLS